MGSFFVPRNKAASDGAISFYLDHVVKSRITRVTYGTFSTRSYDPKDPEHVARSAKKYMNAQGNLRIPGSFSIILPKVHMHIIQPFCTLTLFLENRIPRFPRSRSLEKYFITSLQARSRLLQHGYGLIEEICKIPVGKM